MKATEPCTVIGATMADLPEIMRLLHIMHAESGLMPLDEDCARDMFINALEKKQGVIGVIRGEATEIRAILMMVITRFWYTTKFHLEELFNFISPEHRKSNYADALIRFAKHSADELKIPLVIGVLTSERMEAKVRLYRRRLGMPAGAFFVHGAPWYSERAVNDDLWRTHTRGRKKNNKELFGGFTVADERRGTLMGARVGK